MKLINLIFVGMIVWACVTVSQRGCDVPVEDPTGALHGNLLITHDLNAVPTSGQDEIINGVPFRKWLDSVGLEGHYRICGPTQKFAPDSPFAKLIEQPRKADDWMYAGDYSGPIPENAAEAKATIQRHMR